MLCSPRSTLNVAHGTDHGRTPRKLRAEPDALMEMGPIGRQTDGTNGICGRLGDGAARRKHGVRFLPIPAEIFVARPHVVRHMSSPSRSAEFQRSSMVEQSAVNRSVVGSNPTAGAIPARHSAAGARFPAALHPATRLGAERPEFSPGTRGSWGWAVRESNPRPTRCKRLPSHLAPFGQTWPAMA
jgi:hypothetical protein